MVPEQHKDYLQLLRTANTLESKQPNKTLEILNQCMEIIHTEGPKGKYFKHLKMLEKRIHYLRKRLGLDQAEVAEIEQAQEEEDAKIEKPLLKALESTEMDLIWEFYFLHRYNHPTIDEFYGDENAGEIIHRMLDQIIDIYSHIPKNKIFTETQPGDTSLYYIGQIQGRFQDVDTLMRYFQPKIFESQATENPLRIVFLGNFTGKEPMTFHTLLYLIMFNLAYPKEVLLLRGCNETAEKYDVLKNQILEHFDENLLEKINIFLMNLPVAYYVKSEYKNIFATSGGVPFDIEQPEEGLLIEEISLSTQVLNLKDFDEYSKQMFCNRPTSRLKEGNLFKPIKNTKNTIGFKYSENIFNAFCEKNNLDLIVSGQTNTKKGHVLMWDNKLIDLSTISELDNDIIQGKILQIVFPSDPEYPEYEYEDEEEEGIENDEEEDYDEEGDENENVEEEYDENGNIIRTEGEEDGEDGYEEEENIVKIMILDLDHLES